jgi:hypothetical protein
MTVALGTLRKVRRSRSSRSLVSDFDHAKERRLDAQDASRAIHRAVLSAKPIIRTGIEREA